MYITTIKGADGSRVEASRPTDAELQNEYNYILAENFTKKLLEKGLISAGEYDRIMAENRRVFSPYLADLYPDNALL